MGENGRVATMRKSAVGGISNGPGAASRPRPMWRYGTLTGLVWACSTEEDTATLARELAGIVRLGDTVLLDGPIGSGKSVFVRAALEALGVSGPITSPTFTLVNIYDAQLGPILHVDAYRLDSPKDYPALGLEEYEEEALIFVEWGNKVPDPPFGALHVSIELTGPDQAMRWIHIASEDPAWSSRLEPLEG